MLIFAAPFHETLLHFLVREAQRIGIELAVVVLDGKVTTLIDMQNWVNGAVLQQLHEVGVPVSNQ